MSKKHTKQIVEERVKKLNSMFSLQYGGFDIEPILYESGLTKQSECRPFCVEDLEQESHDGAIAGFVDHEHPERVVFYIDALSGQSDEFVLDTVDHEFHHALYLSLDRRYRPSHLMKSMETLANRFMRNIGKEST